ncbi:MAG: pentapeptide repeat-containing protein, partial [Actinomycetota bacterium]|nr:pentapeptide repeat-containing protein [Actinomycetota bacterium]
MESEDFRDTDLHGRQWDQRHFTKCDFTEADMRGLVTTGCTFTNCDFTRVDLGESRHQSSAFRSCT